MNRTHWFFAGALLLQVLILAAVPAGRVYTLATGRTVFLKTAPVGAFDIPSGSQVILAYEISDLSGVTGFPRREDHPVYILLKEGEDGFWRAVSAYEQRPSVLEPGAVVIEGRYDGWRVSYGIESYFIPEGKGAEIEQGLRANRDKTGVDVKVDSFGRAALVRLHVGDRAYESGGVHALATGTTVFLKAAPVGAFDIPSDDQVKLRYEISDLSGVTGFPWREDRPVYVLLKEGEDGFWRAVSAGEQRPSVLEPGAVVIRGRYNGWRVSYGIESYFIPEGKGAEIEQGLRANRDKTRVEVKVDSFGNAAFVRLRIGDKTYEY